MRIVIIGAGLIGVSTAYFLAETGHEVVVIDRAEGSGRETSFANGGMLTPSQAAPWNTPGIGIKLMKWLGRAESPLLMTPAGLLSCAAWGVSFLKSSRIHRFRESQQKNNALARYSLGILKQLRHTQSLEYDQASTGTMKIYRNRESFDDACKLLETAASTDDSYQTLDVDGVLHIEPALSGIRDKLVGGIYYPTDESGDAHMFCTELARVTRENQVSFRFQTSAEGFVREGNRIVAIKTSSGSIEADLFVLAAGSFSTLLAKSVGITLPIKPVKGYSLTLELDDSDSLPGLPVIDESRHIAMTPLGNRLRLAGIAELAGYDTSIRNARIQKLTAYANEIYPAIKHTIASGRGNEWAGLRPYCCDGVPIMGRTQLDNLLLNTGHGHLGWTMAAGSGKLLADLINTGDTDIDLVPYQLDRFS
ncbi:MAG: D-amino acid dehydrogenase [Gammaproteobacteria bacterium]